MYKLREGPCESSINKVAGLPFRVSEMQPSDIWKVGTPDTIWLDRYERDVRAIVIYGWKECSLDRDKWKTSKPASACSAAEDEEHCRSVRNHCGV
jgi:hypothetical protein